MEERADRSRRDEIGGWVSRLFRRRPPKAKRRRPKQRKDKKDLLGRGLPDDWPSPVDPAKTLVNSQKWCVRSNPTVSVVVVNLESAEYVFECIRQIWQNTTDVTYEIIVVGIRAQRRWLTQLDDVGTGVQLVQLSSDRFFGEACNVGAEIASGNYLCFMRDNVFAGRDCIRQLAAMLDKDSRIGAVGPMFLTAKQTIIRKHMLMGELGISGPLSDVDGDPYSMSRRVDYVSGDAMMVRRNDFLSVGGFDLAYEPAFYEDTDLCFKLRALGREVWYCAEARATGIESSLFAGVENIPVLREVSRNKFIARWKDRWPPLVAPSFDSRRGADDSAPVGRTGASRTRPAEHRRTVAVITPYPLTPGGGERVALSLAMALGKRDRVHLVTPDRYSHLRIRNLGAEFGLDVSSLIASTYGELDKIDWDLAVLLGNEALPRFPAPGRRSVYLCQFPLPMSREVELKRRDNLAGYERILTYSRYARMHILRSLGGRDHPPVDVLSPPVPDVEGNASQKREAILSVGRFGTGGHEKRQDLLIRAFRRLRLEGRIGPDVELHLAGASQSANPAIAGYLSDLFNLAEGLPVRFHLDVPKEVLFELYRDAAVYWHGTGFGADLEKEPGRAEHFGIAVAEAMSAECVPIAFAAGGPTEIITHGIDGFLFRTEDELVELSTTLLSPSFGPSRVEMGRAARRTAAKYALERFVEDALAYLG